MCPTLNTLKKAVDKFEEIAAYDKIYFIDRTETANGLLTIVPVKAKIYKNVSGLTENHYRRHYEDGTCQALGG